MYKAYLRIKIDREYIPKLAKMLTEKWKVKNLDIRELRGAWTVRFITDDRKKVFAFQGIAEKYGGTVFRRWINTIRESAR